MKVKKTLAAGLLFLTLPTATLAMTMDPSMDTGAQVFSDVSTKHPNYAAISYLKLHGVISGYPDGSFKPDQVVNRAEALKIIILGSGVKVADAVDLEPFRDIARTDWFTTYVAKAKDLGIVQGYSDGTFQASKTVTLVESLKILLLTQKVDLSKVNITQNSYADTIKDQWYAKYTEYAKEKNLLDADANNMIFPAQGMTRGKLAEAMYRLMFMQAVGLNQFIPNATQPQTPLPAPVPAPSPTPTPAPTPAPPTPNPTPAPAPTPLPTTVNIDISNFAFAPANITVKAGTTVIWTNKDQIGHTVTSDSGAAIISNILGLDQTFSTTFTTAGVYPYHCSPHPGMKGTITVTN